MKIVRTFINNIYHKHRDFWSWPNIYLFATGLALFLVALLVQHYSYRYIDNYITGTPVNDLLLDNLPEVDLDFFIIQAPLILTFLIIVLLLSKPHYVPFSVKALALFIITRSFFISLTHLGVDLNRIVLDESKWGFGLYNFLYQSNNDFFFSGHVGMPFLMALVFWREKFWRIFFLAAALLMGVAMLLGHMHYSIDIFAAPFITYGIFMIAKTFFAKDHKLITN